MPKVSDAYLAERRRQILDAARACCARDGFHRTTMQDIVRESGLSPGAIYGYFESKGAIVEAIGAERHRVERERLVAARARVESQGGDPADALRELAAQFFGPLRDSREQLDRRVGVQIWAEALRDERLRRVVRRGVDEPRELLASLIDAAQRRGRLRRAASADALARVMVALFQGFVLQQAWDDRVNVDAYLEAVGAMLDALTPRAPGAAKRRRPARRRSRAGDVVERVRGDV